MTISKLDGSTFKGQFLDIPDTSRVSNFLSPRRYLRTAIGTNVKFTDVIASQGFQYIVAEHGVGYYKEPIYMHFKLFQVSSAEDWYVFDNTTKNAVTGISEPTRTLQTEKVYVSLQPKGLIDDMIHIQQQTYSAVVDKPVSRDDIIGNLIVTKVDAVLGVYYVEMKEV